MFPNTTHRTDDPEIMDDFALQGEILKDALDKIAKINQLLGGNKITLQALLHLLDKVDDREITICDLGCGNGDMLRAIADYGLINDFKFRLFGIDANAFTIDYAKTLSLHYPNVCYNCENIFDEDFQKREYDIILCTLTLHHFKDDEIVDLLSKIYEKTRIGIIVNDLHRSAAAYKLFQALCYIFRLNSMSREDGLTSILRGFKKNDLINYSKKLNFQKYRIQWKWAFRYQWIISKI